jgi:hypothetical protein
MPRPSYRAAKSPSRLEDRFLMLWKAVGGPPLEREYRFHAARRWRPDFAHLQARCLIEVEGGIWVNGRHSQSDWREERQIMRQHDPQGEPDERRRLSQPGGWLQCRSGTEPSGGRRDRFRAAEPGGLAAREAGRGSKIPGGAGLAGWRVFRLGPDQITLENVQRLTALVQRLAAQCPEFSTDNTSSIARRLSS